MVHRGMMQKILKGYGIPDSLVRADYIEYIETPEHECMNR